MKVQVVGLGQFGMFLVEHFISVGLDVSGVDINLGKKSELEKLGGVWGDFPSDVRMLAVFPWQIHGIPNDSSLVVNLSSVQQPGITSIEQLGVISTRLMSVHALFGPVGVTKFGWVGKQIIVTRLPQDSRASALLKTFSDKSVNLEAMTPHEHDEKMLPHALAFLVSEFIKVGGVNADPRYLTGSAQHMFGLLEFTDKSEDLRRHILSNPALKARWPAIKAQIQKMVIELSLE